MYIIDYKSFQDQPFCQGTVVAQSHTIAWPTGFSKVGWSENWLPRNPLAKHDLQQKCHLGVRFNLFTHLQKHPADDPKRLSLSTFLA